MIWDSVDELSRTLGVLKHLRVSGGSATEFRWQMSNAQTWTSAALTYEDTCLDGFQGIDGKIKSEVKRSRHRSASAQGVPDPSSNVRDPRAAPALYLFLVRDNIRQLASDDQGIPDQATKDVHDPIEVTRSIPARVPFVSSSRLNSFGGPIQQSSKVKR
uniref:Pectinesterase inhibitor domain-containing protein n=1 Tax=Brassica oleracea var. oleracea TaxID=109376 RepID=A0A0D3AK87_BRAOL